MNLLLRSTVIALVLAALGGCAREQSQVALSGSGEDSAGSTGAPAGGGTTEVPASARGACHVLTRCLGACPGVDQECPTECFDTLETSRAELLARLDVCVDGAGCRDVACTERACPELLEACCEGAASTGACLGEGAEAGGSAGVPGLWEVEGSEASAGGGGEGAGGSGGGGAGAVGEPGTPGSLVTACDMALDCLLGCPMNNGACQMSCASLHESAPWEAAQDLYQCAVDRMCTSHEQLQTSCATPLGACRGQGREALAGSLDCPGALACRQSCGPEELVCLSRCVLRTAQPTWQRQEVLWDCAQAQGCDATNPECLAERCPEALLACPAADAGLEPAPGEGEAPESP